MRMKRRLPKWMKVLVVLLILGGIVLLYQSNEASKMTWEIDRKIQVERGPLVLEISAYGEVKPQNRVEVKPPLTVRLDEIFVKEGDSVKRGDLLAKMSSSERAALLDAARSKSPEALEYWEQVYRPTPLIAPIDGTIIVSAGEPGQTFGADRAVVVISDRLIVTAFVNETDIGKVEVGQKARITLDAYPDRKYVGLVDHIAYESELQNNVNVYRVEIAPDQIDAMFRSGMTAQVVIETKEIKEALLVPEEAINSCPNDLSSRQPGKKMDCVVTSLRFGNPKWNEVETGESNGKLVEVIQGLSEGEQILVVKRVSGKKRVPQSSGFPFTRRR